MRKVTQSKNPGLHQQLCQARQNLIDSALLLLKAFENIDLDDNQKEILKKCKYALYLRCNPEILVNDITLNEDTNLNQQFGALIQILSDPYATNYDTVLQGQMITAYTTFNTALTANQTLEANGKLFYCDFHKQQEQQLVFQVTSLLSLIPAALAVSAIGCPIFIGLPLTLFIAVAIGGLAYCFKKWQLSTAYYYVDTPPTISEEDIKYLNPDHSDLLLSALGEWRSVQGGFLNFFGGAEDRGQKTEDRPASIF